MKNAIARAHREGFAVVHFSVMSNHLHLIVEAHDKRWLGRGMQGLKISIAKRLNKIWRRRGTVFSERYHVNEIATPTQARNTLVYVLGNARKHAAERGERLPARWVDPYSSARQFDGWRQNVRPQSGVVSPAACWLLRSGWRRARADRRARDPDGTSRVTDGQLCHGGSSFAAMTWWRNTSTS